MNDFVPPPFNLPRDLAVELVKMGELLDAGNDAQKIGEAVLDRLHGRKRDSDYKLVAYLIFAKGFKSFQAAQLLCRCGYGSDALSICASIFENVIDLLYIRRAPTLRSRRYIQYEQVEKLLQAQKVLRKKRLPRGRRKAYRAWERKLQADAAPFLKYFPNVYKGWSQKSLLDRARALGGEIAYYERYWIYCGHKHTLPMAAVGVTTTLPSGNPIITVGPHIKEVYNAVQSSTEEFLRLCRVFDHDRNLGLSGGIEKLQTDVHRISETVASKHPELLD